MPTQLCLWLKVRSLRERCVFQCRLFTSILFLKMYLFFVTLFICVHIDKHFCIYFFNYSSFLFLLFCCFFIFLHENLHPGQGEPNSRTLPPCPKEKLCTLLFSNFFQFGESFTRGERLENLSLMKMKDWATQNTRRCAFQRGS